ncbi:MAG: OmpA family protein [Bacteroidales bacterium]|nr:OmpA family protein [Bacteroidales bacterium]
MKLKFIAIAAALVGCAFTAGAQEEKIGTDFFIGISGGIGTPVTTNNVNASLLNTVGWNVNLEFGQYFTPVWGARAVLGVGTFNYNERNKTFNQSNVDFWSKRGQLFGEVNVDGLLNFSHLFSKANMPLCDFYLFLGPTVNFGSKGSQFVAEQSVDSEGYYIVEETNKVVGRFGATAGLGLSFNINKYVGLGLEYRAGVTPSVFGDASRGRKAEFNNRLTLRLAYTIGGKRGKDGFAKKYGRVETVEVPVEVPVEKIVEKIVEKEVIKEVEVANPAASSVFFTIGRATIDQQDKVRLDQLAEAIKAGSPRAVYTVAGYADKGTGSVKTNQKLSEKRAQAVYDYLVGKGVNPSQLKVDAKGGVENMFYNKASLSRVVILSK